MATKDIDARRLRAATNQSLFRDVNERIEDVGERFALTAERLDFLCECAYDECAERLQLTHAEYEMLRSVPTHFAVKSGHVAADVEAIVESNDRYVVVAKLGIAGETATKLDPRTRGPS
jgi:hypothetical protein